MRNSTTLTRRALTLTFMYKLKQSSQFKKDLKRYLNDPEKMRSLQEVTRQLMQNGKVSRRYKPHQLKGNYAGCMECHVGSDFLLIWIDPNAMVIKLVRLGSHSELF